MMNKVQVTDTGTNGWVETEIGKVPSYWYVATVDKIKSKEAKSIISGPFGSNISSKFFVTDGIPVIRGNNLSLEVGNKFIDNGFVFITEQKANELGTWATEDDLIFTAAGTIGQVGILSDKQRYSKYIISNKQLRVRLDKSIIHPLFAYYWFASPQIVDTITQRDTGSTVPLINLTVLKGLPVPIPPLPEQRAIAGVLSSLDDKVDLLHRQNKTLESMAEALWQKMFVEETDPGWQRGKLGDYGEFKNGINYSRNENGDTEYSILNVRDIVESKYANFADFEKITIDKRKGTPYLLQKGDIVIVRSASPGESIIILEDIDNLIYSGFSIRLRCYNKEHSLFLFQFLQSYKKEMDIFSDGTTLKNINQGILNNIELITPTIDCVEKYNFRVEDIYKKIIQNQWQTRTLSHLRDTLLPKLISGEVRVKYS